MPKREKDLMIFCDLGVSVLEVIQRFFRCRLSTSSKSKNQKKKKRNKNKNKMSKDFKMRKQIYALLSRGCQTLFPEAFTTEHTEKAKKKKKNEM